MVFGRNKRRWQGGKGSRFHTNSLARAVHGWIRSPCWRSVTILLAGSPRGGSVAGSSSLPDQRPFFFLLKSIFCFVCLVEPSVTTKAQRLACCFLRQIQSSVYLASAFSFNLVRPRVKQSVSYPKPKQWIN